MSSLVQLAVQRPCAVCGDMGGYEITCAGTTWITCVGCATGGKRPKIERSSSPPVLTAEPPRPAQGLAVVAVVDGDTLAILATLEDGSPHRLFVRLLGIDAPERGSEAAGRAREALAAVVGRGGGRVRIETDPAHASTDKYGRLLRHVWTPPGVGSRLASADVVRVGLARLDDRFPATRYDAALREAWMDWETSPPRPNGPRAA